MLGIIGAMSEEITLILEKMENVSEVRKGKMIYYTGILENQEVVLCKSGEGKVNSAMVATTLILVFGATAIVFTGVAGGAHPDLELGDLVIGTDFLHHDFDATAIGYKLSEIPNKDEVSVFPSDKELSQKFTSIAIELFGNKKVYRGRIVSGDVFVASQTKIKQLRELFDAYAVDMESAAVAHVAHKCDIPCCVIRAISDKADDIAESTYSNFFKEAAKNSAALVVEFTKRHTL